VSANPSGDATHPPEPDGRPTDDLFDDDPIPPERLDIEDGGLTPEGIEEGTMPSPDELPETQDASPLDAERRTEDASSRRLLSDEEAEGR
jgi:hypothetical protein